MGLLTSEKRTETYYVPPAVVIHNISVSARGSTANDNDSNGQGFPSGPPPGMDSAPVITCRGSEYVMPTLDLRSTAHTVGMLAIDRAVTHGSAPWF